MAITKTLWRFWHSNNQNYTESDFFTLCTTTTSLKKLYNITTFSHNVTATYSQQKTALSFIYNKKLCEQWTQDIYHRCGWLSEISENGHTQYHKYLLIAWQKDQTALFIWMLYTYTNKGRNNLAIGSIAVTQMLKLANTSKDVYCSQWLTDRSDWGFRPQIFSSHGGTGTPCNTGPHGCPCQMAIWGGIADVTLPNNKTTATITLLVVRYNVQMRHV